MIQKQLFAIDSFDEAYYTESPVKRVNHLSETVLSFTIKMEDDFDQYNEVTDGGAYLYPEEIRVSVQTIAIGNKYEIPGICIVKLVWSA